MTNDNSNSSQPVYRIKKSHGIRIDIYKNTRREDGMPFHTATVYRSYLNKQMGEWIDTNGGFGERHGPPLIEAMVYANAKIQQLNGIEQERFREQQHRTTAAASSAVAENNSESLSSGEAAS